MKKLPLALIIIFSVIFVSCVGYVISFEYNNYLERQKLEALQDTNLQEDLPEEPEVLVEPQEDVPEVEKTLEPLTILPIYQEKYDENNDLFGWITIEDTSINYPVMQTVDDQNFYLRKDWEKNYSWYGLPFADSQVTLDSNNVIIYGHNMCDGTMFSELINYKDQSFYKNHKYIKFDTLYEEGTYEIISVSRTVAYYTWDDANSADYYFYFHINMDSEDEFNEYVSKAKEYSYFDIEASAEYGDKLLTLSTCDYWVKDARLLVIAKKIE